MQQLLKLNKHAEENEMQINFKKTQFMLFNACSNLDFEPFFEMNGHQIELVHIAKLLGVVVRSDLKWTSNTD